MYASMLARAVSKLVRDDRDEGKDGAIISAKRPSGGQARAKERNEARTQT